MHFPSLCGKGAVLAGNKRLKARALSFSRVPAARKLWRALGISYKQMFGE